MPLYQMLCITTHVNKYTHIKELVRQTATHLLNAGSVVRDIKYMGTLTLPQRMRRHKAIHTCGDYWTLHFDTAPRTLRTLNAIMRRDPRVIRWTVLKLADKVEDIAEEGHKVRHTAQTTLRPTVVLNKQ
ncbi:putative 28S ribosomal protein S6, mitochondrial [Termitomyces sp. J132]|nr:hypothetical protein C0989_002549 [Termitomyces sp. Mn162]KAH0589018.1 hypothetical protein H2248_004794 [Termitomyces sp. 'cryptogamus']KNZ72842.1 putative 28S ribosomal protein S6, mitochondrial [Termitomyces sp. J132]